MDTTDRMISFDARGVCDHCLNHEKAIAPKLARSSENSDALDRMASQIKARSDGEYDCIIGVSGGLDSSYTAHVAVQKMKLRPLLLHVDAGWNTHQAVENIGCLVEGLGLPLHTEVLDWEAVRRLQLSLFRSAIPDLDLVQDAGFFSSLYKYAIRNRIRSVVTGGNLSTEGCREPNDWGAFPGIDRRLIVGLHKRFGSGDISSFPLVDVFEYKLWYRLRYRFQVFRPLDSMNYNKLRAEEELETAYGWTPFRHKHHESRFTRFIEDSWLPEKFGFEKRRAHLSSLIQSGQLTRAEALAHLESPVLSLRETEDERAFLASKLQITLDELDDLMKLPNRTFRDYKSKYKLITLASRFARVINGEKRLYR